VKSKTTAKTKTELRSTILQSATLKIPGIVHGFSTRRSPDGRNADLNLGFTAGCDRTQVERNQAAFLEAVAGEARRWRLQALRQVHSDQMHVIRARGRTNGSKATALPVGDGLITQQPGVLLAIQTADCVPVLLVDPKRCAIGAFHAGWRGTLARVVEKGVGAMRREFGSDPADLRAAIGPCIHACCYEVAEELGERFSSQFTYGAELFHEVSDSDPVREKYPLLFMNMRAPGHGAPPCKPHLDLVEANRRQLLAAGVSAKQIETVDLCTACRTDLLFSHRAEKGRTGRMMAAIGIAP
jgi:YfiH family protein